MSFKKALTSLGLIVLAVGSFSCGRDTGYLYEKNPEQRDTNFPLGLPNPEFKAVWSFDCATTPEQIPLPDPSATQLVFKNDSSYKVYRNKLKGTPIKVVGELCPAQAVKRDIVIVIDASSSMAQEDPDTTNGGITCGRLEAFNAVLNGVNWATTSVGALTFSEKFLGGADIESSGALFKSRDELVKKLTNDHQKNLKEVICAQKSGTPYAPAFKEAQKIFQNSGRAPAKKEIYFVTDGAPSDAKEAEKLVVELRDTKGIEINGTRNLVTVATIMLGDKQRENDYLRNNYSSKDSNGDPIHANVKNPNDLARTLAKMATKNDLIGGEVATSNPANQVEKINIMPYVKDYKFELPDIYIDTTTAGSNYTLTLDYWDSRNNKFTTVGKLELYD